MNEVFYRPWQGARYDHTRTLLLSESAYDWQDEEGGLINTPSSDHPTACLNWAFESFRKRECRYFNAVTRALCNKENPSLDERRSAWNDYAYSIYVPGSVGLGPDMRPTNAQWDEAKKQFKTLLNDIRPRKVIFTGLCAWDNMPDECCAELTEHLQAYRLLDDQLVWCLAIPHPRSRRKNRAFQWQRYAQSIALFRSIYFPTNASMIPFELDLDSHLSASERDSALLQ